MQKQTDSSEFPRNLTHVLRSKPAWGRRNVQRPPQPARSQDRLHWSCAHQHRKQIFTHLKLDVLFTSFIPSWKHILSLNVQWWGVWSGQSAEMRLLSCVNHLYCVYGCWIHWYLPNIKCYRQKQAQTQHTLGTAGRRGNVQLTRSIIPAGPDVLSVWTEHLTWVSEFYVLLVCLVSSLFGFVQEAMRSWTMRLLKVQLVMWEH